MSHNNSSIIIFSAVSLAVALLAPACGPGDPGEAGLQMRSGALGRDKDGNIVYPDIPSTDDGSSGGGAASGSATVDCGGGSTSNLIEADSFDYADHGEHTLTDGTFVLWVCTDHFPIGSAARAEVQAAADLYNGVAGTPVSVTLGSVSHKTIAGLFPSSPTSNYMDLVDNSTIGFPCHAAGDISSWAMNTCRHGDGGGVWDSGSTSIDHFVISVNANAYTFDTVPTATDYPRFENIAHELGHAFGMNHTPDWPDVDARPLLSTIQGNMPILPPHDRGYLRHFYPNTPGSTLNLVASPKVRVPDASKDSGWDNRDFAAVNPTELYASGTGTYLDCATHAEPIFQAQWLNHGQVSTACTVKNRFRIGPAGDEGSSSKITIKAWEAAQMPAASQDRIETAVSIDTTKLASLSKDVAYDLTFKVDRDGANAETDEGDNVVTSTITLRGSLLNCGTVTFSPYVP